MSGVKTIIFLAFMGSVGVTLWISACAITNQWWPLFLLPFYLCVPLPTLIAQRNISRTGNTSGKCMDLAIFITMGLVVSTFALPVVFIRAPHPVITMSAFYFTMSANIVILVTIGGLVASMSRNDSDYPW